VCRASITVQGLEVVPRVRVQGFSLRLKDLPGPVTRVKKKEAVKVKIRDQGSRVEHLVQGLMVPEFQVWCQGPRFRV